MLQCFVRFAKSMLFCLFSFFFTKDLIFTVAWVKLWYHYADCYLNPIYSTPLRCVVVTSASRHLGKCHRTNRALKFKTDDVERRRRRRTISQRQLKNLFFKKWTIPGPFFYFRLLSTADIKCSIYKFCDDGIQTADLWFWKRPIYQLSRPEKILSQRRLKLSQSRSKAFWIKQNWPSSASFSIFRSFQTIKQ